MSLKYKIKSKKTEITYILLIVVFILFIFSITLAFLEINMREKGRSDIRNNYYDIALVNATIDFQTTSTIKLDKDTISININDLNKYTKGNSFNLELYNIGNIDSEISDIIITDIDTNVVSDKVDVVLSLSKGDVITASERKVLNVLIKYNENNTKVEDYYNFNIKLSYREIVK